MPQTKADKIFFEFKGGINTEASPLSFPDGVSLDEENFELLADGSRRRRRGLALESGGSTIDISSLALGTANSAFAQHRWTSVGGNSELNFIVIQVGNQLRFFEDTQTLSDNELAFTVELDGFSTTVDLEHNTRIYPVTFADGLGRLFVAAPFMEPLMITWNADDETIEAEPIPIRIRDFVGVDDGVPVEFTPTTLSTSHNYNLLSRGWEEERIAEYFTDKSVYPAKNMIPWFGYRRLIDAAYAEEDGEKEWNSTKLEQEVFGQASAPLGALYLNPFDTANSALDSIIGDTPIASWSKADAGDPDNAQWVVTINTSAAHGLAASDPISISQTIYTYTAVGGATLTGYIQGSFDVVAVSDVDTFTINVYHNPSFVGFVNQNVQLGIVSSGSIPNPEGIVINKRPRAVAWFAGRVFYAGTEHPDYTDTVFFSQVVLRDHQVGRCFQEQDPTSEHLNELLPTDGGTVQIPGMGGVLRMIPFGNSLYVFATRGIWEISGGQIGFFTATSYSVRKVSDVEFRAILGVVSGEFGIIFASPRGVFALVQDPNSGFVTPTNISEDKIQTLWNDIPATKQNRVQCVYDESQKRYYIFYSDDVDTAHYYYDKALVFSAKHSAWYRFKFPGTTETHIWGVLTTSKSDATDQNKKLKVIVQNDTFTSISICDMQHDDYLDFDGTEQVPYLLTGYDNVGDSQRFRQAPVCHVFMRRTETGVTEVDQELVPVNESSIFLEARWDWADRDITGKFSTPQQVYRHVRLYQPEDADDTFDNGYPVVVTRNKIRGRGRALHLKFYGEEGKDAHLLGWALQYAGTRRV